MTTDRVTAIYDAIDAFQRTHRLPGLQHAQIRGLLAEHLARALPAAVPVPPPADQTALRQRTIAAIKRGPFRELSNDGKPNGPLLITAYVDDLADAVLPVLPAQADRAAEAPAAECSAQNRNYESGPRLCIRAAQHHGDHIDERGFHWSDTVAVYPVSDGTFRRGTDVRALLRRVAAEEQPAKPWDVPDARPGTTDHTLTQRQRPAVGEQPETQEARCPAKHGALGRICELPPGHSGMHVGDGPNGGAVWQGDAP